MTSARDIQAPDANDLVASCRELIAARGLEEIVVAGADTNGILRGKRIPAERFVERPTAGVAVGDLVFVLDAQGEIVPRPTGFAGWWPSGESSGPRRRGAGARPHDATGAAVDRRTGIVVGDFRQVDGGAVVASPQRGAPASGGASDRARARAPDGGGARVLHPGQAGGRGILRRSDRETTTRLLRALTAI